MGISCFLWANWLFLMSWIDLPDAVVIINNNHNNNNNKKLTKSVVNDENTDPLGCTKTMHDTDIDSTLQQFSLIRFADPACHALWWMTNNCTIWFSIPDFNYCIRRLSKYIYWTGFAGSEMSKSNIDLVLVTGPVLNHLDQLLRIGTLGQWGKTRTEISDGTAR